MANTRSAKKMIRKIERRTAVNKMRRSRMRSHIRAVEAAIAGGDAASATAALRLAQPEIMRCGQKNIIHARAASRRLSRLARRVAQLG